MVSSEFKSSIDVKASNPPFNLQNLQISLFHPNNCSRGFG
jgi:hypothetical protein